MAKEKTPMDHGEKTEAEASPKKKRHRPPGKFAKADPSFNPPLWGPHAGRPVKYDDQRHPIIAQMAIEKGASIIDVARLCAIPVETLYQWCSEYPRFSDAISGMADPNIPEIENEVVRKAKKHTVSETVYEPLSRAEIDAYLARGETPPKSKVSRVVVREQDGDNWCIGVYLSNRARYRWSMKPREANNGEALKPLNVNWLQPDDLDTEKNDNLVIEEFKDTPTIAPEPE